MTQAMSLSLSLGSFQQIWSERAPFVVTGLDSAFQICWTPAYFVRRFGTQECEVEDCRTGLSRPSTVGSFFSLFDVRPSSSTEISKLKDWPTESFFQTEYPQLYEDFVKVLPVPEYTASNGIYNLAAYFPLNSIRPDLGPKIYSALACPFDEDHSGSTRLHIDLSDAINVMTYAGTCYDGAPGYALWHIFEACDVPALRDFMQFKFPPHSGDVIHNQEIYLTPSLLRELDDTRGVRPYLIHQRVGEAVFIPAGCPHQVANQANCIKIACDFVSPESIGVCLKLSSEFRAQRIARGWPLDVLPVVSMLYYAWTSCDSLNVK
ncbi:hypothetical protein BV20DRAFT_1038982 [Pilatotrama ljubarskyi]|nr:hypothetical protein BV20DRAFT_1038982 [Pilatotrama ljubarskyi]